MKRAFLTFALMFIGATVCSAQSTFYFPQVADGFQGGGNFWKTTIYLTNPAPPGTTAATIVFASGGITFMRSDGGAFNVQFVDAAGNPIGAGNTIPFQIAGGQTRKFVSRGNTAPLTTGFATVSSNLPVAGTAIFSYFNANGSLISEAGVPAAQALTSQAIVVDTLGGFNTGVAYANPNLGAAAVSLLLLNSEGVAVMPSTTRTLPATGHQAAFVGELFSTAPPFNGTMRITSASPLAAVALRFDPTFTFFTTLPAISLASLLPSAAEWLEQRPWLTPLTSLAHLLGGLRFHLG